MLTKIGSLILKVFAGLFMGIGGLFLVFFLFGYFVLRPGATKRNEVIQDVASQARTGMPVTSISPMKARTVFMSFKTEEKTCFFYSQNFDKRTYNLGLNGSASGQEILMAENEFLPSILNKHFERILECDQLSVTVFSDLTPARRTIKIHYDAQGNVVSRDKPYTWD